MEKLLFVVCVLFIAGTNVKAQGTIITTTTKTVYSRWERNNLNLRLGPEVGFSIGNFGKTHNFGNKLSGSLCYHIWL